MPHGGAAKGSKVVKFRLQWKWLKKIRKIKDINFVVRNTSKMMINAKKFDLFGV